MTATQRKQLKKLLEALVQELSKKDARKLEPNRLSDEDSGGDEDAQPLNEMAQAIASNRNRNDAILLARVDAALTKIEASEDEYGLCQECEEEIPFPRLKAMPYAEYCVDCQAKHDRPKQGATRKTLTDYSD